MDMLSTPRGLGPPLGGAIADDEAEYEQERWRPLLRLLLEFRNISESWKFSEAHTFIDSFLVAKPQCHDLSLSASSALCERCREIDLSCSVSLSSLLVTAESCDLCKMLCQFLQWRGKDQIQPLQHKAVLGICAPLGTQNVAQDIPIGFPALPGVGGLNHFELLREWLRFCDSTHRSYGCSIELCDPPLLPTRVLDVGSKISPYLRLYLSTQGEKGNYLALSHRWDKNTELSSTLTTNVDTRRDGIIECDLAKTFKDAITVTRELGKRFLWVDSFCIIQDDDKDWETESRKMEAVYKNAYCTIAASSADDSMGFLTQKSSRKYVYVPDSSHGPIYFCEASNNFERYVEDSGLNKRGWVLQERALSRRTIHFTACHVYWECGAGIQCESLTHIYNSKSLFMGDPNFPNSLGYRYTQDQVALFQDLFRGYSQLGLTERTDRPVAISSLEKRLAKTFQTRSRYGIFEAFLHRSLLWRRCGDSRMERILNKDQKPIAPSWSWMAHQGPIEYMSVEFRTVEWGLNVRFATEADFLEARVHKFQGCKIEPGGIDCVMLEETGGANIGQLWYEKEDRTDIQEVKCAVIGREEGRAFIRGRRYYIMVVAPSSEDGYYERVGVGSVLGEFISFDGPEIVVRIG